MKGVEFELRDSDGKVLEKLVTDAAGHAESGLYEIATYKNGEFGDPIKYYLVETKALDGYTLDTTQHEIVFCISSSVFPKNRKEKFPTLGMGYSHISAGNIFI